MEYKQVILVRTDLKMGRGKTCAQVAHASLGSAELARKVAPKWLKSWKEEGQKKVVLRVSGEEEMLGFYKRVKKAKVPCYLVEDAGLTELPPETMTTLGIGPAPNDLVDKLTGELRLL